MMRTGAVIIVSAVVALFGVASAVLGFIAEATRLKVSADTRPISIISGSCFLNVSLDRLILNPHIKKAVLD